MNPTIKTELIWHPCEYKEPPMSGNYLCAFDEGKYLTVLEWSMRHSAFNASDGMKPDEVGKYQMYPDYWTFRPDLRGDD